jgi:hypothetical protein
MGWWIGDVDDYPENDEQRANLANAERERRAREDAARHAEEQAQIEAANEARRSAIANGFRSELLALPIEDRPLRVAAVTVGGAKWARSGEDGFVLRVAWMPEVVGYIVCLDAAVVITIAITYGRNPDAMRSVLAGF